MNSLSNAPHVEPKISAAGIILSNDSEPKVLLIRRHEKLRFMGGHHAFPGGRIDDNEGTEHVAGARSEEEGRAIHALAREIFEETGLLCARGNFPNHEELRKARRELLGGDVEFDQILSKFHLDLDADDFTPAGIWITPKGSPIRFHSRYYIVRHEREPYDELIEGEVDRIEWLEPRVARQLWREGKIQLPAPVAYVLQQLEVFSVEEAIAPLRRTTHIVPETPGRIEYRCGIYVLPLRAPALPPANATNCVVVGEKELYVIDPGTPYENEKQNLKIQLDHLLELGGRVAAVLLTHSHPDHVGAATFVRDQYRVPIWAHEATAPQVNFSIDRFLAHNEIINVKGTPDWRLRCIHTPGHDPGHLCFLEETTKTLIAGDMVAEQGTIIISTDHGGDMTQYLESLQRLLAEDFDMILPGHGLAVFSAKDRIRQYIEHRLKREEKIKSAIESGASNVKELLAAAYNDVSPDVWPLAEKSLKAHLVRLGRKNLAV